MTGRRPLAHRLRLLAAVAASVVLLAGCHTYHYAVVRDRAPLFAASTGDAVLARMPRLHHEVLGDAPDRSNGRVQVVYRDRRGWAREGDVRVFAYRDPELDGGRDRQATIRRELLELRLDEVGGAWPPAVMGAVREGRALRGMTREQVELALGWPDDVVPGPLPGTERWVYRTTEELELPPPSHPYLYPRWWGHHHGYGSPLWWDPYAFDSIWSYRMTIVRERRIEFDRAGLVTAIETWRRLP